MDLKLGGRMLAKSPGLTVIAVIALAVAIGAGVAYLEFVNEFFRPRLTFEGGDRLVGLLNVDLAKGGAEPRSFHEFGVWKPQLTLIEELGAGRQIEENLITDDGRSEPLGGVELSASAFRLIPTAPLLGRPLIDDDEKPGAAPVLLIGEDLWKARFNSDSGIVGRTVRFGETMVTVVGVMPSSFGFPMSSYLWTPLRLDPAAIQPGEGPPMRMFGRLAPGVTLAKAQAELESIATVKGKRPIVKPYVESLWSNSASYWEVVALYSFNVFFLVLLGICAANVATLVFARTATRESEITVRTALGASRGRIVAQLVAEAAVLTSVAAVIGLGVAAFGLRRIRVVWESAQGTPMPFWWNEQLGVDTMAYALLLVVLASLLIGGVPGLKATSGGMQDRLKESGSKGATKFGKLWTGVIVTQIAVTVVFLNDTRIAWLGPRRAEQAIRRSHVSDERVSCRANRARRWGHPGTRNGNRFQVQFPSQKLGDIPVVTSARVGIHYFAAFKQPLVAGRYFTPSEIDAAAKVAVVDETFVRMLSPAARKDHPA